MQNSKIIISSLSIIVLFLIWNKVTHVNHQNHTEILNIYEDISNLDVNLKMNIKANLLEYYSAEDIDRVLIFNSRGKIISKKSPINNTISLDKIKDQKLYISFITADKVAFKEVSF